MKNATYLNVWAAVKVLRGKFIALMLIKNLKLQNEKVEKSSNKTK